MNRPKLSPCRRLPAGTMNNDKLMDMGELYVQFLQARELAETFSNPEAKADAYRGAAEKGNILMERLALFGAATHSNLSLICQKLESASPSLVQLLDQELGGLLGIHNAFSKVYESEARFCTQFEHMVRDKMIRAAGIDPQDPDAVMLQLAAMLGGPVKTVDVTNN